MTALRDGPASDLANAYEKAWQRVQDELDGLRDPSTWRARRRLAEIQASIAAMMADLDVETRGWLSDRLPLVWAGGAATMRAGAMRWTDPHRAGLARIADDTYGYLLNATTGVTESTKRLIRTTVRDETFMKLITGTTATQSGRLIARRLAEQGVEAVVYRNGARVGLATYGEMIARTQTALAYNYGAITEASEQKIRYVEVFDGASCGWTSHDDSDTANGSVRTVEEAAAFPIAHPRCLRSFAPRPDLGTARSRTLATARLAESVANSPSRAAQGAGAPTAAALGGNRLTVRAVRLATRSARLAARAVRRGSAG